MSTHNMCFYGEITIIIPKLSLNTLLVCFTVFSALKAIETYASGTMKVYGLPSGQGHWNDMARVADEGHIIILAVKVLALGKSINLHSALSLGYYSLNSTII